MLLFMLLDMLRTCSAATAAASTSSSNGPAQCYSLLEIP
jgi:hypothetical protein